VRPARPATANAGIPRETSATGPTSCVSSSTPGEGITLISRRVRRNDNADNTRGASAARRQINTVSAAAIAAWLSLATHTPGCSAASRFARSGLRGDSTMRGGAWPALSPLTIASAIDPTPSTARSAPSSVRKSAALVMTSFCVVLWRDAGTVQHRRPTSAVDGQVDVPSMPFTPAVSNA